MPTEINEVVFSDIDFNFEAHPMTHDVPMLKNVNAIKRSVKNLVLTNAYEKFYEPNIFSDILASLFENFDPVLVAVLKNKIRQVMQYEPRAEFIDAVISESIELDRNGINISVIFKPINRLRHETVEIFLERVR